MHFMKCPAALLLAAALTSCGGGGSAGGGTACASGDIYASFSYPQSLIGNVGTQLTSTPSVSGVPASCAGAMYFELASGALPQGLALDASTGTISGVPVSAGVYTFNIRLGVRNFSGTLPTGIQANIGQPAGYTFSRWERMTDSAPFLDDFRIAAIGTTLYVVERGFYSHVVQTWQSGDGGVTWTQLAIPGPSGDPRDFALASDGTAIYLSGGQFGSGTLSSQVWRFDGATWTQQTAAGAFPARSRHAMVSQGGTLYLMGGRSGNTFLTDTWKSTDGGTTWTQASASGFGQRDDLCAVSDGAALYVLGGNSYDLPAATVFRSGDGSSWTPLAVAATSPLVAAAATHSGACAWLGGRIVYPGATLVLPGGGSSTVSSADGVNWQFEPQSNDLAGVTPGAAVAGGRMYVVGGSGTSQRVVLRTVP